MAKKKTAIRKTQTISQLGKKYGAQIAHDSDGDHGLSLPCRLLAFNYQIGGGLPYGKILELFGEESSGKSLLASDFAYAAHALGGWVIWVDAEHSWDNRWAKKLGLDINRVILIRETAVEIISDFIADAMTTLRSQLVNNEPILLVTDSIAALDCLANKDASQVDSKAEMGNRAKAIDKMLRLRSEMIYDYGVSTIFINQLRSKIGASMFEDPDTTSGGKAMKFYASIRVGVYGGKFLREKINGGEEIIGRLTSVRVKKNKVAAVKTTLKQVPVYFNEEWGDPGFDREYGLMELFLKKGVIQKKKNSSLILDASGKTIAKGEESFKKLLAKDPDLRKTLIRKTKVNTISRTQAKLDALNGQNLFPINQGPIEKHAEVTEE